LVAPDLATELMTLTGDPLIKGSQIESLFD
jgi:hypothetical protein